MHLSPDRPVEVVLEKSLSWGGNPAIQMLNVGLHCLLGQAGLVVFVQC